MYQLQCTHSLAKSTEDVLDCTRCVALQAR